MGLSQVALSLHLNISIVLGMPVTCREGQEGKSLQIAPGTRNVKEVFLNLLHKVKGQADKKLSISLNAGEMIVLKRLCEVRFL